MWIRTSLTLLATLVVCGLSFPDPDEKEYKIPEVGTGQRSQYYVLHSDGTFKYGLDDGEGGFESVKSHTVGNRDGKFGYVDPDGNKIRLEYEAGKGGFVARGDHLPKPSPEHVKAFANFVKSSEPFVDPWASGDSDASYNFEFASDDHSRNEKSDSDGSVIGSYSYVDENGITRSYNYKAGKGIGFVIEGDGLVPEVPSISSVSQSPKTSHGSVRGSSRRGQSTVSSSQIGHGGAINFSTGSSSGFHAQGDSTKASASQFGSHASGVKTTQSGRKQISSTSSASGQFSGTQRGSKNGLSFGLDTTRVAKRPIQRRFEEANIRSSFIPQGPYSFSYETSSHSRSEKGDENNNVDGKFAFVADDDGQRREIKYEAGSSTGFIAEGAHIPVGPIVPGAPSGQPTGRIVPVSSVPFVDPLASSDTDASYNFGFDSETYSRSETSDKDGNVVGSYTVVDEDGTRRTYNFKAGEGIGFEAEEVSRTQGAPPTKPAPYTGPLAHTQIPLLPSTPLAQFPHVFQTALAKPKPFIDPLAQTQLSILPSSPVIPSSHVTHTAFRPSAPTRTSFVPSTPTRTAFTPATQSFAEVGSSYLPPSRSFKQQQQQQQQRQQQQKHQHHQQQDFQDFQLNTYGAAPGAEKFGYVLRFN